LITNNQLIASVISVCSVTWANTVTCLVSQPTHVSTRVSILHVYGRFLWRECTGWGRTPQWSV